MSTRKILSLKSNYSSYNFPELDLPTSPPIVGVRTDVTMVYVFDDEGNITGEEEQYSESPIYDDDWKLDELDIFLCSTDERMYFSIHGDFTMELLETTFYVPDVDSIMSADSPEEERYAGDLELLQTTTEKELFDLRFETHESLVESMGEDYLVDILQYDNDIRDKYLNDADYLGYLGITTTLTEAQHQRVMYYSGEQPTVPPSEDPEDNINSALTIL